jgi:uncharacterized protein YhfF
MEPGRQPHDAPSVADAVERLRARTRMDVVGAFAFGDTSELADELLAYVQRGTKRATVAAVEQLESEGGPLPAPGQHWGVLDGAGVPRCVIETVAVARGRMAEVTPAFAWDEGEDDRTLEGWLDAHRRFFRRMGVRNPDELEVLFERFRVVWPEADAPRWLVPGVRELRWDERGVLRPAPGGAELPGLVCERDGARVGTVAFRPRPGGVVEHTPPDAADPRAGAALLGGLRELGHRHGWRRLRVTSAR